MPQKLGLSDETRKQIVDYYLADHSLSQTAKYFNCSVRTIRYSLEKLGIETRTVAEGYSALWNDAEYRRNQVEKHTGKPSGATGKTWKLENPPKRKKGEESPGWKGGITKLNQLIRTSVEYLLWKKEVLMRDDYSCVLCGNNYYKDKQVILDVDHIVAFSELLRIHQITTMDQARICKELWDVNNGRVLCRQCHKQTDNYGGKNRPVEYRPKRKSVGTKR